MRWDREDELDLADIGGEAGAATHGASIAPPGRTPKRLDMPKRPLQSATEAATSGMSCGAVSRLGPLLRYPRLPNGFYTFSKPILDPKIVIELEIQSYEQLDPGTILVPFYEKIGRRRRVRNAAILRWDKVKDGTRERR